MVPKRIIHFPLSQQESGIATHTRERSGRRARLGLLGHWLRGIWLHGRFAGQAAKQNALKIARWLEPIERGFQVFRVIHGFDDIRGHENDQLGLVVSKRGRAEERAQHRHIAKEGKLRDIIGIIRPEQAGHRKEIMTQTARGELQDNAGEMIFAALKEKFSVMVVDVPRQMNPLTRYVLSVADHVVIVAEPQISSLRDALRVKDYVVDTLKRTLPLVILNRIGMSANNELTHEEFSKNYGHGPSAKFDFSKEIMTQTARGELQETTPKLNTVMGSLRKMTRDILGIASDASEHEKTAKSGSFMARLKGGK
jgi:hypothetical protein